jgi:hypothetical protein
VSNIIVTNGALEDDSDSKEIILRGTVDQTTLKFIHLEWYQREQGFSQAHINEIIAGLYLNGRVADITLGMRGHRVQTKDSNTYVLQDKVFAIDGGQRLRAMAMAQKERPSLKLSVGAKIYFGTTEESENAMFCKLGTTQVRISASVLFRNKKKESAAVNTLVSLNHDEQFALRERIAWDQARGRGELMTGFTLARITGALHAHKGGSLRSSSVNDLACGLDNLVTGIGEENLRINMIRFFDAIDKCWNVRNLSGSKLESRPHLNREFLMTICMLMSRYSDFWDGSDKAEFYFPDKFVKRMRGFKFSDFMRSASSMDKEVLFEVLRKRLNLAPIFEDEEFGKTAAA